MCVKKNGDGKLAWDTAEAIKLGLIILTIVLTGVAAHYKTTAALEKAITINVGCIAHLSSDVARHEIYINENRIAINHLAVDRP